MTKEEFIVALRQRGIDETIVSFDGDYRDGYCMRKNHYRWEVFVRERGKEYDTVGFPSEDDALQYLYNELCRIYNGNV